MTTSIGEFIQKISDFLKTIGLLKQFFNHEALMLSEIVILI